MVTAPEQLANGDPDQPLAAGALLPLLPNLTAAVVDHLDDGPEIIGTSAGSTTFFSVRASI
ncbi:MAG: hypothetical protein O9289_06040 [Rhodobacteraceae bacterium]|nr:hypothetical protein [Paracoccaceae bacterium]MCZ8082748.1 hypothetical protein [Paracoccaceae bacterium]